ncbi:D-alanyl-D-alanine carboxypeptidase family protein [Cytobacillus solani]|uniref:Peptidase M15 n=1 Tax=Cytobacillus solani TaxID=1637975 RepID=A0A0Q3SKC0_9BACI|nr:M15 family metallopeptidase [Cytobacillus solani]KOP83084.1 peptidase M15 [Bacillus sp. FJAT-21945]KQL20108.1 peptidase M15 [Cytobacillus solani]USK53356.1 M15 family metallopeptidase [Cytobacillus solani]
MKKIIALTVILSLLLAGCSQLDPILEKIPFLKKNNESESTADVIDEEAEKNKEEEKNQTEEQSQPEDDVLTLEAAFFNDVKVVNGRNVIQNPTNFMVLVNKEFSLPDGYTPEDLVRPNVLYSFGDQDIEKAYMRKDAAAALETMFAEAKKQGIHLFAVSGYRSFNRQTQVYNAEVSKFGEEKAALAVAVPGTSEHQTGLTMDLSSQSAKFELSEQFGETPEGKWIAANAHLYGFILRYPKGKEAITGYKYEPWHFRYVGKEAATTIYNKGWTLEEYFGTVKKI